MNSTSNFDTSNPAAVSPNEALSARADERLAHAYEQIALADEQLAQVTAQLSRMGHDAARHPVALPSPAHGRPVLRGLLGLILAACIGAGAYASQSPYGEATRLTLARWAPFLLPTSSPWLAKPENAAPSTSAVQSVAVETTPAQPALAAQIPAQDIAATPGAVSPELTRLLQAMARDIATVEQGIEQLKANQERMAADNARAIEQLKANQEQLTRVAAKPSDVKPSDVKSSEKPSTRDLRAKTPAPAPGPVANAARKPPPARPPQAQARAHPQPIQLQPDDQ
jgi:DNA-binding transcriptional regulator YdaS (Cro superfamily)